MHKTDEIIINTGPIIALVAALGDLHVLQKLYRRVLVPLEVCQEIERGGNDGYAMPEFQAAYWLLKWHEPLKIFNFIRNSLDLGEAAVIQLALNENIKTVCIDEAIGRRVARLNGLALTGSVGVLIRAKKEGFIDSISEAIECMKARNIWLSDRVVQFALRHE